MTRTRIDDVDRAILHALQEDARRLSTDEIGARVGVAGSTVRKRIQRLEAHGLIQGYRADIDYQAAGYPLRMLLYCTAPIAERGRMIPGILQIDGVVGVQELVTGERNLLITVVGTTDDDITSAAQALIDMGLKIADEVLLRTARSAPFSRFLEP